MKKTDLSQLAREDAFNLIGKEWMLVTAGTQDKFNMMTASWGGTGIVEQASGLCFYTSGTLHASVH